MIPKMASEEYLQLFEELKNRPRSAASSIEKARRGFERLLEKYPPQPDIQFQLFFIDSLSACWATAPQATRAKVILFFHGGGFNAGSIESHRDLMGRLSAASGFSLLAIGYRLAPEHPFPAALEDGEKGFEWLLAEGYTPEDIAFVGSSAGGGIALSLSLLLKGKRSPLPAAVACICPMTDLTFHFDSIETNRSRDWVQIERMRGAVKDYAQGQELKSPLLSPLYGDLEGLPPLFLQVGEGELLRDGVISFAEKAMESGVEVSLDIWPEMMHCWQLFAAKVPEGQKAIEQMGKFLKSKL